MIISQKTRLIIDLPWKILTTPFAEVDSMYFLNVEISLFSNLSFQIGILDTFNHTMFELGINTGIITVKDVGYAAS